MRALITISALMMTSMPAFAGDVASGERVFSQCKSCHQVGPSAKNGIGPQLNGLFGRKAGTAENYKYSQANRDIGIIWDETNFKDYIRDPKTKVPGTKMTFAGLKDDSKIDDLVSYLQGFTTKVGK